MHPVTPALRGWKIFVGVLLVAGYQLMDNLQQASSLLQGKGWLIAVGVLAVVAVVGFGYSAVAWRMTRFAVTDDAVHLQTGILFRQQRQARLDRLQAVDVVQPLLARLVGLSELKLEVAGGSGSAVSLAFLREAEADVLRAELLALAAGLRRPAAAPAAVPTPGVDAAAEPTAPGTGPAPAVAAPPVVFAAAPEHQVYEVPMPRLVLSTIQSSATVGFVIAVGAAVVTAVLSREVGAAFFVVPMIFGIGGFLWSRINQGASFRAATSPDGIRLRHGFTEARAQTVPPGRVQAIRISQGLWWRWSGWWRIEINVAGYAIGKEQQQDTVLHPVATQDEVMTAVWLVLPDLGVADVRPVYDAALRGTGDDGGFTPAPRSARWVDPIGWRRHGVLVTQRALITRSGRLRRQVDIVPHERTQSLGLEQGPLQRRLGLASFVVHSTPGPVQPSVAHLAAPVAAALLDEQAERARTARAGDRSEQWMRQHVDVVAPTPAPTDAASPRTMHSPPDPVA
ncbi:MAG: PH domain-containing protein [Cellulomonas sp.]|nr:PH domain-containing protein [Cellulomonas sp.]